MAVDDGHGDAEAGAGFFGMKMGIMAPMMTLVLHIIFGAVMGLVCGKNKRAA